MPLGFDFKLEHPDGTPADPPTLSSGELNWKAGDEIFVRPGKTLQVIATRLDEGTDGEPLRVLVVEHA